MPAVIRERFVGRGALISAAVAVFATVAAAAAFGWRGILVLSAVVLIAGVAELWREVGWYERESERQNAEVEEARRHETTAKEALTSAQAEHAEALAAAETRFGRLQRDAVRLDRENAELREAAESSHVSLKRLLSASESHIQAIERLEQSRKVVARLGTYEWPAVSMEDRDGVIEIVAHVENGAPELDGQTVSLSSKMLGGVIATTEARSRGDRQIVASFPLDQISRYARRLFQPGRALDPDPFTLRLQGFDESSPLANFNEPDLQAIRTALRELQTSIAAALIPAEREDAH